MNNAKFYTCTVPIAFIMKWDRGNEKGPSAYFFKFSNYFLIKETLMSSTTSFLHTGN